MYVANAAGANRFETIFNNVNELENKIMAAQNFRSQGNLEKLDNILKNLKKYNEKTGPEKYDYLGLSKEGKEEKREEVLQFTEISEAEGKEFDENPNNKKLKQTELQYKKDMERRMKRVNNRPLLLETNPNKKKKETQEEKTRITIYKKSASERHQHRSEADFLFGGN